MKKIVIALGVALIAGFLIFHSHNATAALPSTLDASGSGPYHSELIQPSSASWHITFTYTPLNNSASITILNSDHTIRDYKLIPTSTPGTYVYSGTGTDPMYVDNYAGSWSMSLGY